MMIDPLHRFQVKPWPAERLAAFDLLQPAAICVSATDCPLSVALIGRDGHVSEWIGGDPSSWSDRTNSPKGCWPAQLDVSWQYADTATKRLRTADSFIRWALRFRVWMLDLDDGATAKRLLDTAVQAMDSGHSRLLHGRFDAGPDAWRMHWLCSTKLGSIARSLGVQLWTDDELGDLLDEASRTASIEKVGQRPGEVQAIVRRILSGQHALSRPRARTTPRVQTQPFGIGSKVKPWAGDPDIERQIVDALARGKAKVA